MPLRPVLVCCAVAMAVASRIRAPGNVSNASVNHTLAPNASHASAPGGIISTALANRTAAPNASQANRTKPVPRNLTDAEKLEKLQDGLKSIQNVQAMFVARHHAEGAHAGAAKFAEGALTEELSNRDSEVWSDISAMLNATEKTAAQMRGKDKDQQRKIMDSLQAELDTKAGALQKVTDVASKRQVLQDEEYVLGLLNMHSMEWNMSKQLETVKKFMGNSSKLAELYSHHKSNQSLAMQLAGMMDSKMEPQGAKVAAKMFLQLVSELQ